MFKSVHSHKILIEKRLWRDISLGIKLNNKIILHIQFSGFQEPWYLNGFSRKYSSKTHYINSKN